MKEVLRDVETHMKHAVDHFHTELKHLRTGRASLSLLEGITVEYYGTPMPINQLATLAVADASMITAQPFDPSQIAAIERAIMKSDLGLNPSSDGRIIRIPVPQLTEERRKLLVKGAHKHAEDGRVAIRNVRRDVNDHLKKLLKSHEVGEDEEKRSMDEVQKLTDAHIEKINEILKKKEAEVMEV
jgi:ribosome recycling factor